MWTFFYDCSVDGQFSLREDRPCDDDTPKECPKCGVACPRGAMPITRIKSVGIKVDRGRFRSLAFGKEFKNEKDMRDYAKFHGYTNVGDEPVDKIHKRSGKIAEENDKKFYEDLDHTTKMIAKDL